MLGVNSCNLRDRLRKRDINCAAIVHAEIKLVRHLPHGTFFGTCAAAGANVLVDVASFFLYGNIEISDKAMDFRHFRICENSDFFILSCIDHLRSQNAGGAVQRRKSLVELSHLPADCRFLFDNINFEPGICNIKSSLNTRNAAAYHERTFRDGRFGSRKRCIKVDLCNSCFSEYDRLFGSCRHILMHP